MNRRDFLKGTLGLLAATPFIGKASSQNDDVITHEMIQEIARKFDEADIPKDQRWYVYRDGEYYRVD